MATAADRQADLESRARRPLSVRPRVVLFAAVVVGALSVLWALLWPNPIIAALIVLAGAAVVVWATAVAMRRQSVFIAPLAVVLVALCNPLVFGVVSSNLDTRVGRMTFSFEDGLLLWKQYPGIAGWDASDPRPVDTGTLVVEAQNGFRAAIDALSDEFGWAWQVGDVTGVTAIPNGYGGDSMFRRVDMPVWQTGDFDGSQAQRDGLLSAVASLAATLQLSSETDVSGDVTTGDGERTWTDDLGGRLQLTVAGEQVALAFVGGPYFSAQYTPEQYEQAMAPFDGVAPPDPLVVPDVPHGE